MKSKGVGDTIAKITKLTGVEKAVHFLFGEDCGCKERQEKLNKLFPYSITECITPSEYIYLSEFNWGTYELNPSQQQELLKIYNRVFNLQNPPTSCSVCWRNILGDLHKLYNEYSE